MFCSVHTVDATPCWRQLRSESWAGAPIKADQCPARLLSGMLGAMP